MEDNSAVLDATQGLRAQLHYPFSLLGIDDLYVNACHRAADLICCLHIMRCKLCSVLQGSSNKRV